MKNTKKLLLVFAAVVLLASTAFAVASSAVTAGEGTSIQEYTSMKLSISHGFEDRNSTPLFSGINNGGSGGVIEITNAVKGVSSPYGNKAFSRYYYIIDYDQNKASADNYIQPKLGDLNRAEKTPENGFISEFDIAFLSPVEVLQEQDKDPAGVNGLAWKYTTDKGENGEEIRKYRGDTNENGVIDPGEKWEPVMVNQKETLLDDDGNPVKDDDGNEVIVDKAEKGQFTGLTNSFNVGMYNTYTYVDGKVDLMSFKTDAANKTVTASFGNDNILSSSTTYTFNADEWCHVTVQYDAASMFTYVYVGTDESYLQDTNEDGVIDKNDKPGRLLVAKKKAVYTAGGGSISVYPLQFRLGCTSTSGVVAFDNFIAYQGTTIHDPLLISSLPAYQQYIRVAEILDPVYMSKYTGKENVELDTAVNRYQAYSFLRSDENMQKVYSGESYGIDEKGRPVSVPSNYRNMLNAAIRAFDNYYNDEVNGSDTASVQGVYDALVAQVKIENADIYFEYATLAYEKERSFANAGERGSAVKVALDFLDSCGSLMDRESENYKNAAKYIAEVNQYIEVDKNSYEFIKCMKIFTTSLNNGASVSRLRYHYANATSYVEAGIATDIEGLVLNGDGGAEAAENLKAELLALGLDEQGSIDPLIQALKDYEAAGGDRTGDIFEELCAYNSIKFISLVSAMQKNTSGNWEEDGEDIRELWVRAYDIIYSGDYDADYEGFAVSKAIYDLAGRHFWTVIQNEHIAVISAKLDEYDKSEATYIDRAGICTYVDRYLQENAAYIDTSNAVLKREVARNESYKERLSTVVGDYKNLLIQNTTEFMNIMKAVQEYETYEMLKPLYDEANKYYYKMNIDAEGIEVYLDQYEILRAFVTNVERDSQMYIDVINGTLTGVDGTPIYQALAEINSLSAIYESLSAAYLYTQHLDLTFPGAKEAKEIYDAKYEEYHTSIQTVNALMDNSQNLVYAVRGNWDFDGIIAFVKNLLNGKER